MKFLLYNKDGELIHESSQLRYIRRFVKKDNVERVGIMSKSKSLLITFKNKDYMDVTFPSLDEARRTLQRWRNLKNVKQVEE